MISTRVSAAVAAVLLVAASVFSGTLAAHAVVLNPPVITTLAEGTIDQTPLLQGTVENPNGVDLTVRVFVSNGGGTVDYCLASVAYTDTAWSCSGAVALPYGSNSFSAVVWEDPDPGAISGSSNPVVLSIGGTQPAVVGAPAPGAVTPDATPTFSGTGPSMGLIDVNDGGGTSFCLSPIDEFGNWACTASPMPVGAYNIQADPTLVDGTAAPGTAPQALTIAAPPPPTVDQMFTPWITSATTREIQGNKDIDISYIQVYSSPDGVTWNPYCQTSGSIVGATVWFCDLPFGSLTMGTNQIAAIGFSETGMDASLIGPSAIIQRVPQPTISAPADGSFLKDSTPTFSGTSASGTSATVYRTDVEGSLCAAPIVAGGYSCEPAPLADGTYSYFMYATPGDGISSGTRSFTIDTVAPAAPPITGPGTTTTSTHPVLSGTAEPLAPVTLYRDGVPAACEEGAIVASAAGTWSCTSSAPLAANKTFHFGAVQEDKAGNRSHPGVPPVQLSLTVLGPAPPALPALKPGEEPPPPPMVFQPWSFEFVMGGNQFEPGDTTQLSGAGLPPGAVVDAEFHSTPVSIGSTVVAEDGTFNLLVTIPADAEPGEHLFVVTVTPVSGLPSTREQAVTVVLPERGAATPPKELDTLALDNGAGSGVNRTDPAAPSSLTSSITTFGQIQGNPVVLGTAAFVGLALLLLVAFPAELLNSTISEQYSRFSRRIPRVPWFERFTNWLERTPLFGGIAITIAAAVIFGFADPAFGFEATSTRVVLACAIALFIVGYLARSLAGRIIRERWHLRTVLELKPLGLLLAVAGVVISRVIEFSPGFLIGLLIGIGLLGRTTPAQRAKATLVQSGVVFVLAMLGWAGYSILTATVAPDSFASTLALDTMVALTTEGLTALFIGLLPFKYLDGAAIFEHSKVLWAVCYAAAAAAFVLVVVPSAWGQLDGSLTLWITVVGSFAAVAAAIYLYFRFIATPIEEVVEEPALESARS